MNFLVAIGHTFRAIGRVTIDVFKDVPKVIEIYPTLKSDFPTLISDVQTLLISVGALVTTCVVDAKPLVSDLALLIESVTLSAGQGFANVTEDSAILADANALYNSIKNESTNAKAFIDNLTNVINAYDAVAATIDNAVTAIKKVLV